jgi:hypothetical protein
MLHDHDDIGDFIAFEGYEYDDREKRQACSDCRASPDDASFMMRATGRRKTISLARTVLEPEPTVRRGDMEHVEAGTQL